MARVCGGDRGVRVIMTPLFRLPLIFFFSWVFMTLSETLYTVGHALYKTHSLKEYRRYVVFRIRAWRHRAALKDLLAFFDANDFRRQLLEACPSFFEQATRGFFYRDSTLDERIALIKNHVITLEEVFDHKAMLELYRGKEKTLYSDEIDGEKLEIKLLFHAGQRKEGCLAMAMSWEGVSLFQIMFRFAKTPDGTPYLAVGALQGYPHGGESVKKLTKAYEGYRPKNLIFFILRLLAQEVGAAYIEAVTNDGYYAMNHVRLDRKLKTDFSVFWQECEGTPVPGDERFYRIPVEEPRKSLDEVKSNKRAQYRRRFDKLDAIEDDYHTCVVRLIP